MAFGSFRTSIDPYRPMAEINVTPLVDVTLVLLVVFIITAPLLTYAIKLDLPAAQAAPRPAPRRRQSTSRSMCPAGCTGTGSRSMPRRWRCG
jgi:biopolymer transport protein ExbD